MKKFVIFGNPIVHSKSPQMQNAGFKHLKFDANYEKFHLENGKELKNEFIKNGFLGANITVPHKEDAFLQADEVVGIAKEIKAVNTYILKDDKVFAYNTDAPGFIKAIESFGKIKKVLVLGAGGTSKAICLALKEKNIDTVVLNRSKNRLDFFIENDIKTYSWEEFEELENIPTFDLVVNSTSAGLKDDLLPASKEILEKVLRKSSFTFDCIYGKITPFLALAEKLDNLTKDGEDMLLYQGVLAFELFTNTKADEILIETMRKGLSGE
ncbi:Shikimate dehydrogenase [Aliarcobacter thereius]|uniref:Shikimate dehydrogenase (NADP(+)) n=1 Tax=Aliarcobacter thereius TaxID=544718 RepID=A0A1C0B6S6_9BACT|nr:shikimate dehydrogenase [Aliarcobacter thereius]OCL99296.1 Shikimate dehydrogenase [Aliarcobacter thereius]